MNLMLLTDAFLPHSGGARVYYYNLYKPLAQRFGHRVTVVTKKAPGWEEFDRRESVENFRILRRGWPLKTWKYRELPKIAGTIAAAAEALVTRHADLIATGDLYPPGMTALCLRQLTGKKYLTFLHGDELAQIEERRFQPKFRDAVLRNASALVAANEFARCKILETGIAPSKVHVLTPGVDLERFHPEPASPELVRRYGLGGKIVILTAARLAPKKGHAVALQAFARVLARNPDAHYLIVGDGGERVRLERLTQELNIQRAVTFVGDVPNETLGAFYNLCDVFVMPNRRAPGGDVETFGMVFIEANAAGKPVIGGRSGGAIEAVAHNRTGFLVDPDDVEELSRTMELLISHPDLRARMGSEGLRRARAEYAWDSRAEYMNELSLELHRGERRTAAA